MMTGLYVTDDSEGSYLRNENFSVLISGVAVVFSSWVLTK